MKASRLGRSWGLLTAACLVIGGCPSTVDTPLGDGGGPSPGGETGNTAGIDSVRYPFNSAPSAVASATPDQGLAPDTLVTLDASGSSDPDGDVLTFEWTQTAGAPVTISDAASPGASFMTPRVVENTELRFGVTVRDGRGGFATAEVSLVVEVADAFAGHPQSVSEYRSSLTSEEAYHLLRRAAFGARPEDVQRVVQQGLAATVAELLRVEPVPATVAALAETYDYDLPKRWLVHMLEGPNPLLERMAMFWHDRFAASRRVLAGRDRGLSILHWQMLRGNALGNYRDFLEALTLDPLMLIWLDGANSPKKNPNENYAREFWELFTLGRDVLYTETDIREAARAFTGISLLRESGLDARPIFDLLHHDETLKSVWPGRADPANYNYAGLIDLTLAQPESARYVARNLFVFFIHEHPSQALIDELAEAFVAANFEIAPLVRRILLAQAMFSPEARGNQVSSPVEHIVGVARTLDMHLHSEDSQGFILNRMTRDLRDAGQELLNPPGVQGWDETGWLQYQWILNRARALGRTMEYGPDRTAELPFHLLPPEWAWGRRETRGAIVDGIASAFHLPLTDEERAIYVEVLDENGWRAFHLQDPNIRRRNAFQMIRLMAMDERVLGR